MKKKITKTRSKVYVKEHYACAQDLYSALNWLTEGCEVLSIIDNPGSGVVVVNYKYQE